MSHYPQVIFGDLHGFGTGNPNLPHFSILDFPLPRKESTWRSFPETLYFQPETLIPLSLPPLRPLPLPISRSDSPTLPEWNQILQLLTLPKTVLARKTTLTFSSPLDPLSIISSLHSKAHNALVFGVILSPHLAFVGATPELLFKRKGRKLYTEALAGTRLIHQEKELLSSQKDLQEFAFVKEDIREKLALISKPFSVSNNIYVKKTANLCHLHYPFEVELREDVSDFDLISLLHPTSAIGGTPKDQALAFIYDHEPFDRGWYAGTIGMLHPSASEVYVGIRSAIIEENQMHLFAGAGIVNNSLSNSEWQELENKIKIWN